MAMYSTDSEKTLNFNCKALTTTVENNSHRSLLTAAILLK